MYSGKTLMFRGENVRLFFHLVFFLCLGFHLMRQSKWEVRANKQFQSVDNDAQRIGVRFLNHSTDLRFWRVNILRVPFFGSPSVISQTRQRALRNHNHIGSCSIDEKKTNTDFYEL